MWLLVTQTQGISQAILRFLRKIYLISSSLGTWLLVLQPLVSPALLLRDLGTILSTSCIIETWATATTTSGPSGLNSVYSEDIHFGNPMFIEAKSYNYLHEIMQSRPLRYSETLLNWRVIKQCYANGNQKWEVTRSKEKERCHKYTHSCLLQALLSSETYHLEENNKEHVLSHT